jgi:serine protease Do
MRGIVLGLHGRLGTRMLPVTAGVLCLFILANCAAPPAIIPPAELQDVRSVPMGEESRPLRFDRIVIRIPRGHVIGRSNMGLACFDMPEEITYRGGRKLLDAEFFEEAFVDELLSAGYNVVGDPNALFKDRGADQAELIVGGLITDVRANVCYNADRVGKNYTRASGESFMEVEWQVLDRLTRRTVYKGHTSGTAESKQVIANGDNKLLVMAFAEATKALLADEEFYALATQKRSQTAIAEEAPSGATEIRRVATSKNRFQENVTTTRARVVTVRSGGHGSGFFISDNLLLTNDHVVGGAQVVAVRLVTGRELVGEVVATNATRDVALIRTEPSGLGGLPLRMTLPQIGDRVFVVGSPMDEDLENTVSAGIVSAYRDLDGLRYIQSDANVLPGNSGGPMFDDQGNVVAITVAGMFGSGSGLNLFIPLDEALRALNIEQISK